LQPYRSIGGLDGTFRYLPELKVLYGNNPKCACSTAKASLWRKLDEVTGQETFDPKRVHNPKGPFFSELEDHKKYSSSDVLKANSFSIVRNPYTRALSAYFDKVGSDCKDKRLWRLLSERYDIRISATKDDISFYDFLRILRSDVAEVVDTHFRPQHLNLYLGHMTWDALLRLERPAEVSDYLGSLGVSVYR